jgi:hypothetical protein
MAEQVNDEWTIGTLKAYLEMMVTQLEKATAVRMHSQEVAVTKAEVAIEARLTGMNEFRGQLNDLIRTLLPRGEYEVNHVALERQVDEVLKRIEVNSARLDVLTGKSGGLAQGWTILVSVLTMGIALYALLKP